MCWVARLARSVLSVCLNEVLASVGGAAGAGWSRCSGQADPETRLSLTVSQFLPHLNL